ncbi:MULTISPECIES: alpha/beta hydrolase [Streptosporangium]|uniref:S-formylglutathione hydrolase FrmB n=1 Tax=Streptosporangium brasiliense TaxID=47480 RepID=A0ABT9RDY4_9ACTN|nr:alpha/beta hydrolase family protein [Streptosporangium brasiliense]MDP9867052.1 S-formylglutathione hydrolase FrmB [Streptosporangium brasiliense]
MAPGSRLRGLLIGAVIVGGLCVLLVAAAIALAVNLRHPAPAPAASPTSAQPLKTSGGAEVVKERRLGGRRMELTLRSPALDGVTTVRLLLPEGWSKDSGRSWPTLWLLHGGLDGYQAWSKSDIEELTEDAQVIVVMPDGGKCGSYSDWYNGGDGGPPRWATYHLKELLPLLESRYAASGERAVAGYSMGGQGAMLYAATGNFRAAASFSGAVHTLMPGVDLAVMLGTTAGCFGTDWKRIWGDPHDDRGIWRAHDPYHLAGRLRGVRLYVAAGDGRKREGELFGDITEELADRAARSFTGRLKELGIPVETHFYSGRHNMTYWNGELRRALPMLLDAIGAG